MRKQILLFFKGFAMGIAEVIPGVSGGTIALVTGIYARFIHAIKSVDLKLLKAIFHGAFWSDLLKRLKDPGPFDKEAAADPSATVAFFIVLMFGMGLAILLGVRIIPGLLADYPAPTRGFFLGLVLASILIPFRLMERRSWIELVVLVLFAVGTFLLMGLQMDRSSFSGGKVTLQLQKPAEVNVEIPEGTRLGTDLAKDQRHSILFQTSAATMIPKGSTRVDVAIIAIEAGTKHNIKAGFLKQVVFDKHSPPASKPLVGRISVIQGENWSSNKGTDPALWFIFICGAIAISAMILPGISGSFLLLMLGLYRYIIGGLKDLLYFKAWDNIPPLAVFSVGLLVGIALFSRVLSYLLERYPSQTMAALIGLMLGSTRRLWPYQRTNGPDVENILPASADPHLIATIGLFLAGVLLVVGLEALGKRNEKSVT